MNRKRLGESLVEAGLITTEQLNHALTLKKSLKEQKFRIEKLGRILINLSYIGEDTLIEFLGKQHGTLGINLSKEEIDEKAAGMIPKNIAEKYRVIPVGFKLGGKTRKLVVAMTDPSNLEAIDTISFITGYSVEPVFAREEDLNWIVTYHYNKKDIFDSRQNRRRRTIVNSLR